MEWLLNTFWGLSLGVWLGIVLFWVGLIVIYAILRIKMDNDAVQYFNEQQNKSRSVK